MCGIVGSYGPPWPTASADAPPLRAMADRIAHRGPDGYGEWFDAESGVALAHRRLAILELSEHGHQPMASADGRYLLAFNGEVYNHRALRQRLEREGAAPAEGWRGGADTETLLAVVSAWGFEAAIESVTGMFAIALWDRRDAALWLARDRLGEKPLSIACIGSRLVFASEISAFRADRCFKPVVNQNSLALFMRYGYVPTPHSILANVVKFPPGHAVRIDTRLRESCISAGAEALLDAARPFWRVVDTHGSFDGGEAEAVDELDRLLGDAVAGQMLADVPVGAFLSGGVDSSTIVALMQRASHGAVRTFSIGFEDPEFDESEVACAVATHLGTHHTGVTFTEGDARALVPELAQIWDEPFADVSQMPIRLLSATARRDVTVALSGDGGDELFGGYNRYSLAASRWRTLRPLPTAVRHGMASMLRHPAPATWDGLARVAMQVLPARRRHRAIGDKLHKLAGVLDATDFSGLHAAVQSMWPDPALALLHRAPAVRREWSGAPPVVDVDTMMTRDAVDYLPDDVLVKVDRAAMSVALETRCPLLDHRVVAFARSLPAEFKTRGGAQKWALRSLLARFVPRAITDRPKQGFAVPVDAWLRGELRPWAEELLEIGRRGSALGALDRAAVHRAWSEHQSGRRNNQNRLWPVLMYRAWLREWCADEGGT
jgi:asparagine synthase (glutamine-hydrolysing)